MSGDAGVGLAEAIRSLRAELSLAMQHGAGEEIRFRVGPVELEFLLEVTQEAGIEGGVRFYVVSLGGKGSVARSSTHRITLSLLPLTAEGKDVSVVDEVAVKPR